MFRFWLLCTLIASAFAASNKPVSAYFKICHLSDPKMNDCIKKTLEDSRLLLSKGIPALDIVPIEPLFIPKIEMGDVSGQFGIRIAMTNLKITGMKAYVIKKINFDFKKKFFHITLWHPKLDFDGDYELQGKILALPVNGNGKVIYNFTDITTINDVTLETYKKNGKEYFKIKNYDLKIQPGHVVTYFSNLFNGDKTLGESTNKFLNENWKEAYEAYRYLPEKAFSQLLKALSDKVYSHYPVDELFLK